MASTIRQRVTNAASVGVVAALLVVAAEYFIALPLGNQPSWLTLLAIAAMAPSSYIIVPLRDPVERWLGQNLGSGKMLEVSTPFGPALRASTEDLLLVAFGTIVMVGLLAYLASGLQEMLLERRTASGERRTAPQGQH